MAIGGLAFIGSTDVTPALTAPNGTVTVVVTNLDREALDPGLSNAQDLVCNDAIYDALIGTAPDGTLSPGDGLAERWKPVRTGCASA